MKIRSFQEKDAHSVKQLIVSILSHEYPLERVAYPETDLESIPSVYGGKKDAFFVLEDERGTVVGTVAVKHDTERTALMRRLFLAPGCRGKGWGKQLSARAIAFCREAGYDTVVFRATSNMKSAIEVCKRMGFEQLENIPLGAVQVCLLALRLM